MASELSREQVEQIIDNYEMILSKLCGSDGVNASDLLKHDAALRQQLEQANKTMSGAWESLGERSKRIEELKLVLSDSQDELYALRQRVEELDQVRQRDAVDGQSALDALNHEIAALTATLAAVEGELQCGHSAKWYAVDDDANDDCLGCRTIHLQQQLAAAQAKIIALTDALESGFMKGAYARLSELQHKEQKLYEAEARILELEQALRLHLAVAADDPILLMPIEVQLVKALARIHELEAR